MTWNCNFPKFPNWETTLSDWFQSMLSSFFLSLVVSALCVSMYRSYMNAKVDILRSLWSSEAAIGGGGGGYAQRPSYMLMSLKRRLAQRRDAWRGQFPPRQHASMDPVSEISCGCSFCTPKFFIGQVALREFPRNTPLPPPSPTEIPENKWLGRYCHHPMHPTILVPGIFPAWPEIPMRPYLHTFTSKY
jgi:hypothetical protein